MNEYRCSICEGFLTVTPDPIHTRGMIVEPCECINCDSCAYFPDEEEDHAI